VTKPFAMQLLFELSNLHRIHGAARVIAEA
jgi:hypothetical protein